MGAATIRLPGFNSIRVMVDAAAMTKAGAMDIKDLPIPV